MATSAGLATRFAAWRVLHDVRHDVPFDLALRRAIVDLGDEDQRLVHELAAGVYRNRSSLDRALGAAVTRGLASVKADTLDVLRLGAFQLLSLDRVPPHAAIQTTVAVAKRIGGEKVAGFVNAVLRKIQRSGAPGVATGTDAGSLAERWSHPEWLVSRWLARFGPEETAALLAHDNRRPPLTIQPARWTRNQLEESLRRQGVPFAEAPFGAGLTVEARKPTELAGFAEGGFIVQDAAQQLVVTFFDPEPGGLLFDACAAPGGKSVALAPRVRRVVAADRTGPRVRRLADTVGRAGNGRIDLIRADAARPPLASADVVLLDVPCLGTGTFARNPDARWRVTERALGSLVEQAARFLRAAAEIVAPNGLLLFATCSLEPEENEAQIDRFLSHDDRFRREPSTTVPPELLTEAGDLLLLPQRSRTDGGYAARLRKIPG